jgi:hypothetical protein
MGTSEEQFASQRNLWTASLHWRRSRNESQSQARLERLEARTNPRRQIIIWDDHEGSAEREIAKLKAAGNTDDVEIVIVSWLP